MKRLNVRAGLAILCVLAMSVSLGGCAKTMAIGATDATRVPCQSFQPIRWSSRDTDQTVLQAKEHNASGKALGCWK